MEVPKKNDRITALEEQRDKLKEIRDELLAELRLNNNIEPIDIEKRIRPTGANAGERVGVDANGNIHKGSDAGFSIVLDADKGKLVDIEDRDRINSTRNLAVAPEAVISERELYFTTLAQVQTYLLYHLLAKAGLSNRAPNDSFHLTEISTKNRIEGIAHEEKMLELLQAFNRGVKKFEEAQLQSEIAHLNADIRVLESIRDEPNNTSLSDIYYPLLTERQLRIAAGFEKAPVSFRKLWGEFASKLPGKDGIKKWAQKLPNKEDIKKLASKLPGMGKLTGPKHRKRRRK